MTKKTRREAATNAAEEAIGAGGMMAAAPTQNKCDRYLRLPSGLQLFDPKPDVCYRLIFLPWKAGKNNPSGAPGVWVQNRFLYVHKGIGADSEWHLCPQKTLGQPCEVCKQKSIFHAANRTRPWKEIQNQMKALTFSNRELFLIHDLEGKPGNIQIWEEACYSFGDNLRKWIATKTKYSTFADWSKGCIVEVTGKDKPIENNSFTEYTMIQFVERKGEDGKDLLTKELIEKAKKFCPDNYVLPTSPEKLKALFLMTSGQEDEDEEEETEDSEEEEAPPVKKSGKKTPAKEESNGDDEDEDEEEETEDSEEEEEEAPPTKKPGKKATKKPAKK